MSKQTKKQIVMGSDPEIFVEHEDGSLFPAFEFLPSKYEPAKTKEGENIYYDGFQAEYNVTPSADIKDVLRSLRCGLECMIEKARVKDAKARLSAKTVVDVDLNYLKTLPYEFVEFGCMPSFNVYQIAGMGIDGIDCPHRFSGGHIHFGCGPRSEEVVSNVMKTLDAILGVACVSLFENLDNPVRRRYYGLVGEFRLPPHGLEYRTLSNAWIYNPKAAETIFDLSRQIMDYSFAGNTGFDAAPEEVIETVLLSDVDKARGLLERNADVLKKFDVKNGIDLMRPIEAQLNMTDIEKNWKIA